ncbi:MAG TPA: CNNM domain-containing protein, partial [Gemmatimonadaceae bacterium]
MTFAAGSMIAVLGLVLVNGFFVAAEFALVAVRRSKLDEMIARGDRAARTVQSSLQHLDRYIAATQLGITIASLALGWVGEPVLAHIFDQVFRLVGLNPSPAAVHVAAV